MRGREGRPGRRAVAVGGTNRYQELPRYHQRRGRRRPATAPQEGSGDGPGHGTGSPRYPSGNAWQRVSRRRRLRRQESGGPRGRQSPPGRRRSGLGYRPRLRRGDRRRGVHRRCGNISPRITSAGPRDRPERRHRRRGRPWSVCQPLRGYSCSFSWVLPTRGIG